MTEVSRTPVPAEFRNQSDGPKASDAQVNFVRDLLRGRQMSDADRAEHEARIDRLSKREASALIDALRELPKRSSETANVAGKFDKFKALIPEGSYALAVDPLLNDGQDIKFYRVSHGKEGTRWEHFVFLDVYASDDRHPIKNPEVKLAVLEQIAADPRAASVLYGLHRVHCGVCGRKLTRKESREAGIGPVCAETRGW